MAELTSLRLAGWKSIRDTELEFRRLNVLIGGNGAGKSNLLSFFQLMGEFVNGRLLTEVRRWGGAESLLYRGQKTTSAVEAEFRVAAEHGSYRYAVKLIPAAGNDLVWGGGGTERLGTPPADPPPHSEADGCRNGEGEFPHDTPDFVGGLFSRSAAYHFHDTSLSSPMRRECYIHSNRFLARDASNLPAMLYLYREKYPTAYRRVLAAVRAVTPDFQDFVLEPLRLSPLNIALHWRSRGSDYELGPHQFSDGTLRAIALFTLLLQPGEDMPGFIILDEPELGLHPAALAVLADLLRLASERAQVLIATQSAVLIDHFDAADVVAVNQQGGATTFERLDPDRLNVWLEEYTLSELWERNIVGGGPY